MVVHDIATGAMAQLPRFLDLVMREKVEIVQDFPPDCVPIRRGKVVDPIDHLASAALT